MRKWSEGTHRPSHSNRANPSTYPQNASDNEYSSMLLSPPFTVSCCGQAPFFRPKSFSTVEKLLRYVLVVLRKPVEEVPVIWIDVHSKSIHLRRRVWEELTKASAMTDIGSMKKNREKEEESTTEAMPSFASPFSTTAAFSSFPSSFTFSASLTSPIPLVQPPVLAVQLSESNLYEILDPCDMDVLELVGGPAASSGGVLAERLPCIRGVVSCTPDSEKRNHSSVHAGGSHVSMFDTTGNVREAVWEDMGSGAGGKASVTVIGEDGRSTSSPWPSPIKRKGTHLMEELDMDILPYDEEENEEEARMRMASGGGDTEELSSDRKREEEDEQRWLDSRVFNDRLGTPWCSFVASRRVLLTFHEVPFVALRVMQQSLWSLSLSLFMDTNAKHISKKHRPPSDTGERGHSKGGAGKEGTPISPQDVAASGMASSSTVLPSTASLLSKLVCTSSEARVGDPTALLSEVDCMDEMVLLIAPGDRDQPDLLRRVALLRRRISADRSTLYLKEKLLHSFMAPSVRSAIVCSLQEDLRIAEEVRKALKIITQIAERLDDARDTLNQANLNFVTGVSMRISQSSSNMDFKMQVLSQVAIICLPLNLVASIFGMNCTIPFMSDNYPSLTTFWVIIALMVLWCVICSIPTIRAMLKGNQHKAIVPTD